MSKTITTFQRNVLALAGLFAASLIALVFMLPAPAHAAQITTQLDVGMTSADVTSLQNFLATNPLVYPEGLVTGHFGPLTQTAVTQFQIAYGLPAVGRVGPLTAARINSLMASGASLDVSAPSMSNVQVTKASGQATLSWNTNEPTKAVVFYSGQPVYSSEVTTALTDPATTGTPISDQTLSTAHSITLTGLQSGQIYYFIAHSTDQTGNVSITLSNSFVAQ